jgi:filamentous hemagglutinin family protein
MLPPKRYHAHLKTCAALMGCVFSSVPAAYAADLPQGGQLVNGSSGRASISVSPDQRTMTIQQKGAVAALDWASFSIGQTNVVDIRQSKATDLLINRVTGPEASLIAGKLQAQGRVFLINPNGITISSTGIVQTQGFLASTLDLKIGDDGAYTFATQAPAAITVDGRVSSTGNKNYLVLLGGQITIGKSGILDALNIALGAGESAELNLPTALSGFSFREVGAIPNLGAAAGGSIAINGNVRARNGALFLDAGGYASSISVDGIVTAQNSSVSIRLGDEVGDLRIGNATQRTSGAINFIGDRTNAALTINGRNYGLIWTIADLKNIANNMWGYYALAQNLDFAAEPAVADTLIGPGTFHGGLNGLGHRVSNLRITMSSNPSRVGLLGALDGVIAPHYAFVSNLGLANTVITPSGPDWGMGNIGAIAGEIKIAKLSNNWVTGTIQTQSAANGSRTIGGLVGDAQDADTFFLRNYFSGTIIGPQNVNMMASVGGIAGSAGGQFIGNRVTRTTISGGLNIGGIAGTLEGSASSRNDSFDGTLTSWNSDTGNNTGTAPSIGGLFGIVYDGPSISRATVRANILARGSYTVIGGLIGTLFASSQNELGQAGILENSSFDGSLSGGNFSQIGGAIGYIDAAVVEGSGPFAVFNVSANAKITAGENAFAGGIVGYAALEAEDWFAVPDINRNYAYLSSSGSITAGKESTIGGIFGRFNGSARGLSSTVTIAASPKAKAVGGIAGVNAGMISDAIFTGNLSPAGSAQRGALVGILEKYRGGDLRNSVYGAVLGLSAVGAALYRVGYYDVTGPTPIGDTRLYRVGALSAAQMISRSELLRYFTTQGKPAQATYFNTIEGQLPTVKNPQ